MADILVDSTELEANYHPDDDYYTQSGHSSSKKCSNNTIREKKLSKLKNRPGLHK